EELAHKAMAAVAGSHSRLLVNARADVALACGAHGVHLPAYDLPASEVRTVFSRARGKKAVIAVSAHSAEEAARAESHGADFVVFAPVFEKAGAANAAGLETLRQISRRVAGMPVLALGGVTLENARLCLEAGAPGIAGIRLFQENEAARIVKELR